MGEFMTLIGQGLPFLLDSHRGGHLTPLGQTGLGHMGEFMAQQGQPRPLGGAILAGAEQNPVAIGEGVGSVAAGEGIGGLAGVDLHRRQVQMQKPCQELFESGIEPEGTATFHFRRQPCRRGFGRRDQ
jgi:hypothetical protein